jgi:hypothetical protein
MSDTADMINSYSAEFDQRCLERHEMGVKKYGPVSFLNVDSLEMAIEEIIDLENYIRYTFVKLRMLQDNLPTILADKSVNRPIPGNEMMGKDALRKSL